MNTPNFDGMARLYRWLEYLTLGPILQRTRTYHLPSLTHCRSALLLGDGDGRFTAALLSQNPTLQAHAVDVSPSMLAQLRRNAAPYASRLTTTHSDIRLFTPATPPDLIVTHFFVDCLIQPEVDDLVARLAPLLQPHALWLYSDFRIPQGVLSLPARLIVRLLYLAFRLLTNLRTTRLPNHAAAFRDAGLQPIAIHHSLFGLLTTELWQAPPKNSTAQPSIPH
jgi:SAM-dependent methyltransferase